MGDSNDRPLTPDESASRLQRLIRMLEEQSEDGAAPPPEEALEAFLAGKATAAQQVQILETLENSRGYRREVAEIAADLEKLLSSRDMPADESESSELPEVIQKKIAELPSGKLHRLGGPASFLAATALIIVTVIMLVPSGPAFRLQAESIERNLLISLNTRSPGIANPKVYGTRQDAALAAFRHALVYVNAEFVPGGLESERARPIGDNLWAIEIHYPYTGTTMTYNVDLPAAGEGGRVSDPGKHVECFALTLPGRDLFTLAPASSSTSTDWKAGPAEYLCVTLVYPVEGGYSASPARVFSTK